MLKIKVIFYIKSIFICKTIKIKIVIRNGSGIYISIAMYIVRDFSFESASAYCKKLSPRGRLLNNRNDIHCLRTVCNVSHNRLFSCVRTEEDEKRKFDLAKMGDTICVVHYEASCEAHLWFDKRAKYCFRLLVL